VIAYAGAPLVTDDGYAVGALCVIDDEPKTLKDKEIDLLKKMARVVMKLLSAQNGGNRPTPIVD
jgi:GAF domain-containing protein